MNGSDVWGSSAPYGDVLPVFKWNIYIQMEYFYLYLQSAKYSSRKKMPSVIWKLLISLLTGTAIILRFMKLLIFLINIPFEHGEDVTIRR